MDTLNVYLRLQVTCILIPNSSGLFIPVFHETPENTGREMFPGPSETDRDFPKRRLTRSRRGSSWGPSSPEARCFRQDYVLGQTVAPSSRRRSARRTHSLARPRPRQPRHPLQAVHASVRSPQVERQLARQQAPPRPRPPADEAYSRLRRQGSDAREKRMRPQRDVRGVVREVDRERRLVRDVRERLASRYGFRSAAKS